MVFAVSARLDVDNEILLKTIIYRKHFTGEINDLATDEPSDDQPYNDFEIKAQCTVQRFDSKYVQDGILIEGDLVGLFRYQYIEDANGKIITPTLIPKSKDLIKFLGQWFSIKQCTPATNEDDGIIGWDFTASQTGIKDYEMDGNNGLGQ